MSLPGRFLSIGGNRVFYHRRGRGRPLVLVHGWMVSHWAWRHVIPSLAGDYDVVAIDLPGFGESDRPSPSEYRYDAPAFAETLIGVLDSLAIERATLVGHSMGGGVALYAAARRPERVERLVLIDALVY
ncbi:MAG TPA: alpha/beta fold hydrolase, partial [Haliangiales bacterium]|nr:alpha/beta fold hydrolase [Haliangiales bacterium]